MELSDVKTNQDAFDFVCEKLVAQGYRSTRHYGHNGACSYRGEDGRKCAVGWLIPDERFVAAWAEINPAIDYCGDMDDVRIAASEIRNALPAGLRIDFLRDMQNAHDKAHDGVPFGTGFVRGFAGRARTVACKYDLSTTVLDALVPA